MRFLQHNLSLPVLEEKLVPLIARLRCGWGKSRCRRVLFFERSLSEDPPVWEPAYLLGVGALRE